MYAQTDRYARTMANENKRTAAGREKIQRIREENTRRRVSLSQPFVAPDRMEKIKNAKIDKRGEAKCRRHFPRYLKTQLHTGGTGGNSVVRQDDRRTREKL